MHVNIPPQSRLAETKLRLVLSRSRISFVHGLVISICYLVFRWNESNIKCSLSYLLSNKMKINFDVLCPCMKHWISSEVSGTEVITPQHRWSRLRNIKFTKKRLYPYCLGCTICQCVIFSFSGWSWHRGLLPRAPRHQIRAKEKSIACSRTPVVYTACPISISKNTEQHREGFSDA